MISIYLTSYLVLFVIIISILYYFWTQNKKEHFNNLHSNLVFTSAGDNTNFDKLWTYNKTEVLNYDIWVVYYGNDNDKYNQYKKKVNKIWKRKGGKFPNFNYIYNNFKDELMKYDRFYIVDDDIIMNTEQINELFNISKQYNLSICQPAFLPESKISHKITLAQPNNILRYTNFVEVNTPVFSKDALIKLMKVYDDSLIGWGIDYLFIWANGLNETNKYAIIDKITCINPHDEVKQGKRELDNIKGSENRAMIWYNYSKKIGCPYDWPHITYKTIESK